MPGGAIVRRGDDPVKAEAQIASAAWHRFQMPAWHLLRGDGEDGVTIVNGTPFGFHDITSHDFMLGMRWMLNEPAAMPAPIVRKG